MKETGMLFAGAMVRAILEGRKTQTRRVLKNQRAYDLDKTPFGQSGDRIYVRETWAQTDGRFEAVPLAYRATDDGRALLDDHWKPSIHMPKWAARIWLEVTSVRVERLQEISPDDCIAEGAWPIEWRELGRGHEAVDAFRKLWESTGGDWNANPWVWVVNFKVLSATGKP